MSKLSMTDDEIRTKHRKGTAIGILAELNACSVETIKQIVGVKAKEVMPAAEPVIVLIPEKIPAKVREAKQLELYNQGKADVQIADAVGVSPQLIFVWRKRNGYPNQKVRKGVMVPSVVPPEKKAPVKARPVDKVMPMLNKVPKPVIKAPKTVINTPDTVVEAPKEAPVQHTYFEPKPSFVDNGGMFFADVSEDVPVEPQKPAMTLLGQEVKNFDDVTRVMQEANAVKKAIAVTNPHYGEALTLKEGKAITQEGQEIPCTERDDYVTGHEEKPKSFMDLVKAAGYPMVPVRPICPVIPVTFDEMHSLDKVLNEPELENRVKWEDKRKASVMHALFKRLKDAKELPAEWVAE